MMIFDIDFDKWIATMLPTFLRLRRVFAFCRALCSPLYLGDDTGCTRASCGRVATTYTG